MGEPQALADGILADDSEQDHVGKAFHERPPNVTIANHPSGWHGSDSQNLSFKLIHKTLPRPGEHAS
jgi:hypothetical protein